MSKSAERSCVTFRSSAFGVTLATPDQTGDIAEPGAALMRWLSQELPAMGVTCDHAPKQNGAHWTVQVRRGSADFTIETRPATEPGEGPRWQIDVSIQGWFGLAGMTEKGRLRVLSLALCVDSLLRTRPEIEDIRWHPGGHASKGDWSAWARLPDMALADSPAAARDIDLDEKIHPLLPGDVRTRGDLFTLLVRRWKDLERDGPLTRLPLIRAHATTQRQGVPVTAFAALYPPDTAASLIEFIAFIAYIATIERDLIRFGTSSLEKFAPDTADVGARRLVQRRDGGRVITGAPSIQVKIEAQGLPARFDWLLEREHHVARVRQNEADIALYARSDDGWLSLFAMADHR